MRYTNLKSALDYKRAARYIEEVARQLASLHNDGKVHRDIRPERIVLGEAGYASLDERQNMLFPESLESSDAGDDDEAASYGAEIVDSLAPELALHAGKADGRADIYGLGCVLYFLLTGRPPFATGTITERLLMHQHAKPEAISRFRPDVPHSLAYICEKMTAKKPADRYSSAHEVVEEIGDWRPSARWF